MTSRPAPPVSLRESLRSFIAGCRANPGSALRRVHWKLLRYLPERVVSRRTVHGWMAVSSRDTVIGRNIYLTGGFALHTFERAWGLLVAQGRVRPRDNPMLLDVGANIGTICIPLVRSGRCARAFAFEPDAQNLALLCRNIRRNGLQDRIDVRPFGLSVEEATLPLERSPTNHGDHRVWRGDPPPSARTTPVRVRTLDQVLADERIDPASVSLIWMDTQGHEHWILEGARCLLAHAPPLVTELWPAGLRRNQIAPEAYGEALAAVYSSFVDLADSALTVRSTRELAGWARRQESEGPPDTDLVLF